MSVDLTKGIVRILNSTGDTVGAGFALTDDGLIVTCAHVIAGAGAGPGDTVHLIFHANAEQVIATVQLNGWRDPTTEDLAFLRLDQPLPKGIKPLPLCKSVGSANHAFETFGFPTASPNGGLWGTGTILKPTTISGAKVLQLQSTQVSRGFSGGPVLDTVYQQVVGMVTAIANPDAHGRQAQTAFITPTETIAAACPELTVSQPADSMASKLSEYREYILRETEFVSLKGIVPPSGLIRQVNFPLERVYVRLQAVKEEHQHRQQKEEAADLVDRARETEERKQPASTATALRSPMTLLSTLGEELYRRGETAAAEPRPEPVDPQATLAKERRLVILGAPGAGKSTLLRVLARQAAKTDNDSIPILVSVREYVTASHQSTLRSFALEQTTGGDRQLQQAIEQEIERANVLWLIDGLDEAGGGAEKIASQANRLPGRLIITSRPVGYPGGLPWLPHFELLQLTADDAGQFLLKWFELLASAQHKDTSWARDQVASLQAKIEGKPRIAPLLRNPLLLTFLAILYAEQPGLTLPESRSDLYRLYIRELLLRNWEQQRSIANDEATRQPVLLLNHLRKAEAENVLWQGFVQLGWHLHHLYYGGQVEAVPDWDTLVSLLIEALQRQPERYEEVPNLAKETIDFWRKAGLLDTLNLEGSTFFTFRHLTFQEYAAALYLTEAWQADAKATWRWLKPRLYLPTWREPLLLMSSELTEPERNALVSQLLRLLTPIRFLYPAHNLYEATLHHGLRLVAAVIGERKPVADKLIQQAVRRSDWLSRKHSAKRYFTWFTVFLLGWVTVGEIVSLLIGRGVISTLSGLILWTIIWISSMLSPFFWNVLAIPTRLWNSRPRHFFLELLGQTRHAVAAPPLIRALRSLSDLGWFVRSGVAEKLGQVGETIFSIFQAFSDDHHKDHHGLTDYDYMYSAVEDALEQIGAAATPALIRALSDRDDYVRSRASYALLRLNDITAVPALIHALRDSDTHVRSAVATALGSIGCTTAVPALIQALGDSNWSVRAPAASALGRIGDAAAVPILVQALTDSDSDVRKAVVVALGLIGDTSAVPALIQTLGDSDHRVRSSAAGALGWIGDAAAVPALIQALSDSDSWVRSTAVRQLGQMGDATVIALIHTLGDSDASVRRVVAEGLKEINNATAVPALIEALDDSDERVREVVSQALGKIGDASAVPALIQTLGDSDHGVRRAVTEALEQIGDAGAAPALIQTLGDRDYGVRSRAAKALGQIGDVTATLALIEALDDIVEPVREAVANALGQIGDTSAIPALIKALSHRALSTQFAAAKALGQIGDTTAVSALVEALDSSDDRVRYAVATTWGKMGDTIAVSALVDALESSNDRVRYAVVKALGQIGDTSVVSALSQALRDSNSDVRKAVVAALAQTGNASAVTALIQALSDSEWFTRYAAAKALGQIGDATAVPALIQALGDGEKLVRSAAAIALQALGLKVYEVHILRRLLRRLWWWLPTNNSAWLAMDSAVQQLATIEVAQLPFGDIPVQTNPVSNRWNAGLGTLLVALGILLVGLGQGVVGNLLAAQIGAHVPAGWPVGLTLVGLFLLFGGVTLLFQRWLARS